MIKWGFAGTASESLNASVSGMYDNVSSFNIGLEHCAGSVYQITTPLLQFQVSPHPLELNQVHSGCLFTTYSVVVFLKLSIVSSCDLLQSGILNNSLGASHAVGYA